VAATVVGLLGLAALASCGGSTGGPRLDQVRWRSGDGPRSFALALGADLTDSLTRRQLVEHDLVVVDGTDPTPEEVAMVRRTGTIVLGYLSVGTLEPGRPWFAEAEREGWLLDRWEQWDEWYANVADPGLRTLLIDVAADVLATGVDGLFLDNTDLGDTHPDQRAAMAALVAEIDALVGPERLLFAQNGDPVDAGLVDHLDGWNREDVTFTWDAAASAYVPTADDDRTDALEQLQALHDEGLLVTATDYLPELAPELVAETIANACGVGALPFAADIDLTQVPEPPLTCG
jgi:uncharacterized protein (TIGR01370 family)